MTRRQEVADALIRILADEAPEIKNWRARVIGVSRGKEIEGAAACDRIKFADIAKGEREATATFIIYILDPANAFIVEDLADKIDKILTGNPTLDGWASDSRVKEIVFGVAQGIKDAALAALEFEVKFDMKESEE
jgi:hypothetical protein